MNEILLGPFKPDLSNLDSKSLSALNNVLPQLDGYGPIKELEDFTDALSGACRGYFYARKSDGSIAIFAGTVNELWLLNNTNFSWTNVTKDNGMANTYASLSTTAQWQFAQFNNFVFATQANEVLQVFNLTSSTEFDDVAGNPPQAAYISIINRFIALSGLLSQPYRVHWSGLNDTTEWTAGSNFSDFQDLPDGGIVRGVAGGEYGLIMQDQSIRRMIYSPGSEFVFQIDRVAQDRGMLAPYSLVAAGERMFFLSAQGFIESDASGTLVPIGNETIDKTFFDDYDAANPQLMIGAADPVRKIVVWAYRSINTGLENIFDRLLIYDWSIKRWSMAEQQGEYVSSLSRPGLTLENLDDISSSLDALPFPLDSVSTATLPALSFAGTTHMIGFLAGPNKAAFVETGEYSQAPFRTQVNGITPIGDSPDIIVTTGTRDTLSINEAPVYSEDTVMNEDGFAPVLDEGRYVRVRFTIPAGSVWKFLRGFVPEFTRGSRL